MVISNYSTKNQPFLNGAVNPGFLWAQAQAGSGPVDSQVTVPSPPVTQEITVQPPPFQTEITVQPDPITQTINGQTVVVSFPPVKQTITFQPPAIQQEITVQPPPTVITVAGQGTQAYTKNLFESVGFVSGNPIKLCCLVRPNIVAAAAHYPFSIGNTVNFFSVNGPVTASIKGSAGTFGDLQLYYLDSPISGITPAQVLTGVSITSFAGLPIVSFGLVGSRTTPPYNWTVAAVQMKIARITAGTGGVWSATCASLDGMSITEPGDSGSPNFVLYNNAYYYLGSDQKMGTIFNVNVIIPWMSQINSL